MKQSQSEFKAIQAALEPKRRRVIDDIRHEDRDERILIGSIVIAAAVALVTRVAWMVLS